MDKLLRFNNKLITNGNGIVGKAIDPYNPLNLPAYTIRLKYDDGYTPTFNKGTGVQVSQSPNVWDLTYENDSWYDLFNQRTRLLEVLGANTTGVTNMSRTFIACYNLTSVSLFDTSNVTSMAAMFSYCGSLTSVPLFNTNKVTSMVSMFSNCTNVQSGALALYQQASTQANPPSRHSGTFQNCGSNTQTGAAELAQIPDDWK